MPSNQNLEMKVQTIYFQRFNNEHVILVVGLGYIWVSAHILI